MLNSVVFRVCVEAKHGGVILDYTPDYYTYLGEGEVKDLIGTNINNLIFPQYQEWHMKMINNPVRLEKVINSNIPVQLYGYDTFLKQGLVLVKLCSVLDHNLSAFVYFRIQDTKTKAIGIFNDGKNFLAGTRCFWDVIDKFTR